MRHTEQQQHIPPCATAVQQHAVTSAAPAWQQAWADAQRTQDRHPSYHSLVRDVARVLKSQIADTRAVPVAWLEEVLTHCEHMASQAAIDPLPGGFPAQAYVEAATYVRAFLARWASTAARAPEHSE